MDNGKEVLYLSGENREKLNALPPRGKSQLVDRLLTAFFEPESVKGQIAKVCAALILFEAESEEGEK